MTAMDTMRPLYESSMYDTSAETHHYTHCTVTQRRRLLELRLFVNSHAIQLNIKAYTPIMRCFIRKS